MCARVCAHAFFSKRKVANDTKVQGRAGNNLGVAEGSVPLKGSSNSSGNEGWPQWNACGCQKQKEYEGSISHEW